MQTRNSPVQAHKLPHLCLAALLFLAFAFPARAADSLPGVPIARTEVSQDVQLMFSLAGMLYPPLFTAPSGWRLYSGYTFQYFGSSNIYVGVKDGIVFAIGGSYGDSIRPLGPVNLILALLKQRIVETNPARVGVNLVLNPSFEFTLAGANFPIQGGLWQGDLVDTVTTENGIAPRSGTGMLKFIATGNIAATTTFASQQWQIIDMSAMASAIDLGTVVADGSAWFNRVTGDSGTDRRMDLRLLAFAGSPTELATRYPANNFLAQVTTTLNTSPNVWTRADATLTLPVGTRYVLVEIYAFEDVENDNVIPEFDGHYADDISLVLRVP